MSAETPAALHENPLHSSKSVVVHSVSKSSCGAKVLWRSSRRTFSPSAVIIHCLWHFWYLWKEKNKNIRNLLPFVWYILDLPEIWVQCSGPGSSVSTATGYGLDGPEIDSRWRRDFPHLSRAALEPTQPPVQCVPGLFWGKERPGRDADPSPASSAVVMKGYSYNSTLPTGRTACTEPQCLYEGALYFTLLYFTLLYCT
jgi:hypothetical protein